MQGTLHENWSEWFDGMTICARLADETVLTGPVIDQAALHGLLNKIRDLGLPLLSIRRIETENMEEGNGQEKHGE